jgi:hypothetical protein
MWKPASAEDVVDATVVMAGMKVMETALLSLTNVVSAQRVAMSSIARE